MTSSLTVNSHLLTENNLIFTIDNKHTSINSLNISFVENYSLTNYIAGLCYYLFYLSICVKRAKIDVWLVMALYKLAFISIIIFEFLTNIRIMIGLVY